MLFTTTSRRGFLTRCTTGLAGGVAALHGIGTAVAKPTATDKSRVALMSGDSRPDIVYRALKAIEPQIKAGLARKKRVVIKPNCVSTTKPLCATHVECLEAILEFLKPLVKDEIVVAESAASGPVVEGFDNYGYDKLAKRYRIRLADLDHEAVTVRHVVNDRFRPTAVRFSALLFDPDAYVISPPRMKTHDRAFVTLSLKNIVFGAPLKDRGFHWGRGSKGRNDKPLVHGGRRNEGIHFNLFNLARQIAPDLAVLDGFEAMEGNGPVSGTPVDHRIALASTDWLAADSLAATLMGFDLADIGYLTFAAQAGMGEGDPQKLEILGEPYQRHIRTYRRHDNIESQYRWKG